MKPLNHQIVDLICNGEHDKAKLLVNEYVQQVKNQLHEEAVEQLLEIDWNAPDIVKNALDADIQCGFEAETLWTDYESAEGSGELPDVYDIVSESPDLREEYQEWIRASKEFKEAYDYAMQEYRNEWVYANLDSSELEDEYREEDGISDDQEIDQEKFIEWLEAYFYDYILEDYDDSATEDAELATQEELSLDDWVEDEYNNMYNLMDAYGIDPPSEGDLPQIAQEVEQWVEKNSKFKEVIHGDYHSGSGQTDVWRVEPDGSIKEFDGAGVEVISPAYDEPSEMLEELEKWLTFMTKRQVVSMEDTGLHVTMSMSEKKLSEPNRVKMAVLLDDEYLLKEFEREFNQYTPSQLRALKSKIQDIENGDKKSIEDLEKILEPAILDRRGAIHFKTSRDGSDKLNEFGNQMVEFRIMGNLGYEFRFQEIKNAIVRYATIMQVGYDETLYRKNYLTKLARLIDKATSIDLSNDKTSVFKDDLTGILTQQELNVLCKLNNDGKDFTSNKTLLNKFAKHFDLDPKQDQDKIKSSVLDAFGEEIEKYCQERQKIEIFEQILSELKIDRSLERFKDTLIKQKDYTGALNQIVTYIRVGENKVEPNARIQRLMRLALKKLNITTQDLIKHASHWGVFQDPETGKQYADALSRLLGTEIKTPEPKSIKKFKSQSGYALVKGSVLQPLLNAGEPLKYYDDGLAIDLTDTDIIGKIGKLGRELEPHEWTSSPEVKELSKKLGVPIAYPGKTIYSGEQFNSDLYYLITQGNGKITDLLFKVGIDI